MSKLYLLYHELRDIKATYSYVLDTATFEQHVNLFAELDEAKSQVLRPEVTFDDGHISNLELATPILHSRGLRGTFFVTVGWTGKRPGYMGWQDLKSLLAAGQSIGAHGWTHKLLTHCSDQELQVELVSSRLTLEDRLGMSITTMSLPGGRYNTRILSACQQAGYTQVYTSIPRAESVPLGTVIGRLNILGNTPPVWIAKLFEPDGTLLNDLGKKYRQKETVKGLIGDRLYAKLWALVNRKELGIDGVEDITE